MPNYKKTYFKLLRAQTKAIKILIEATQQAEAVLLDEKKPLHFPTKDKMTGDKKAIGIKNTHPK